MKNSLLNDAMNSMSSKELSRFREFLSSPYHNKNRNVETLYNYIIELPLKKRNELTNRDIHKKIYEKEKFSNENVKTLLYLLNRLFEKFLVINSIENNEAEYNNRLLSNLNERRLDKHFERMQSRQEKKSKDTKPVQIENMYEMISMEKIFTTYFSRKTNERELYKHNLKESEYLITAFLVDIYKQYVLFWRFGYLDNIHANDFTSALVNTLDHKKIMDMLKEKSFPYFRLVEPFYKIFLLMNDEYETDINSLLNSIRNNDFVTPHERFILSTNIVNVLYYKVLKKGTKHSGELFAAFKLLMELYPHSGEKYLRYSIFSNIIRLGVQLGEYEWTENYINKYHVTIDPEYRENMYNYSNSYLAYGRGDYEKCLGYEAKINYTTFQQRYYLRDLRLCALYELGKYESALSLIDSYKHFIRTDKSYKTKMKQGYLLFLTFINDLIRFKLEISRKDLNSTISKLNESLPMRKDWLVKKFGELA